MVRLDIYSSQSLFRFGHVLLICVGGSVCHGEGYPNHFGRFLACPVSQHRYVLVSRLISALSLAIYLISPQAAQNAAHSSSPHPAIFYLALSLPAVPYRSFSWPFAAKANSRYHLKGGKHRE